MINLLIRGLIIYVAVILCMRLMGKRQIGELQPGELVITILLSEVASMPLQDGEIPLLQCLLSIFLLVGLEVISSVTSMKLRSFRTLLQGHSVLVINDGEIVENHMKLIRYSVDDLVEALRLKDIFDISQVQYAYIETNGSISATLKPQFRPITPQNIDLETKNDSIPCLIISDGKIIEREFNICHMTKEKIIDILHRKKLCVKDILIMIGDRDGNYTIVTKKGKK